MQKQRPRQQNPLAKVTRQQKTLDKKEKEKSRLLSEAGVLALVRIMSHGCHAVALVVTDFNTYKVKI